MPSHPNGVRVMSTASSDTNRTSVGGYGPAASAAEQVAEAIGCIVSGRPLPAHFRPAPFAVSSPATVGEGIARVLGVAR